MQFKHIAVSAFAATALAAPQQASSSVDLISIVQVLQTALPSSLYQEALTNSAAAASEISAEFAAGSTPAWYTALPTAVQSYLQGAGASMTGSAANVTAMPNATVVTTSALPTNATLTAANGTVIAGNGTTSSGMGSATSSGMSGMTTTSGSSGSQSSGSGASGASVTTGSGSSTSTGGAAVQTALSLGLAGAVGMVGLFAL